jgi:hypothetical protein
MKHYLMTVCFAALAVSAVGAQEKKTVPPPPKPAHGPSFEVTMKFIQDKLNEQGSFNSAETINVTDGSSQGPNESSFKTSVVEVNPPCGLSLERAEATTSYTWRLRFKDVEKLEVLTLADYRTRQADAAEAVRRDMVHYVFRYDPPVYALAIYHSGKGAPFHMYRPKNDFFGELDTDITPEQQDASPGQRGRFPELVFRDEDMANRVAKALVHAVELCGGGSTPEPF